MTPEGPAQAGGDVLIADTVARLGEVGLTVDHVRSGSQPTRLDPRPVARIIDLLVHDSCDRGAHRLEGLRASVTGRAEAEDLAVALGGQLMPRGDRALVLRLPKRPLSGE